MCETTYPVVMLLKSNQKYFDAVLGNISEFYSSQGFRDKQTFLNICSGFMCNESVFDQYLLTDFLSLQKDRVVNVRVALGRILQNHMKCSGVLAKNTYIVRTIELLKNDPSKEVREIGRAHV